MTEPNAESQPSIEDEALQCVRCGLCLSTCPGYRESLNETDSPRARVALVRAIKEGLLEKPTDENIARAIRIVVVRIILPPLLHL